MNKSQGKDNQSGIRIIGNRSSSSHTSSTDQKQGMNDKLQNPDKKKSIKEDKRLSYKRIGKEFDKDIGMPRHTYHHDRDHGFRLTQPQLGASEDKLSKRLKMLESSNKTLWLKLKDMEKVQDYLTIKVKKNKKTINMNTKNMDDDEKLEEITDQIEEISQKFEKFKARIIVTINQRKNLEIEEFKKQLNRLESQEQITTGIENLKKQNIFMVKEILNLENKVKQN